VWQAERSMTRNIPTIAESRRSFIKDGCGSIRKRIFAPGQGSHIR
jgi:hypothetical protein